MPDPEPSPTLADLVAQALEHETNHPWTRHWRCVRSEDIAALRAALAESPAREEPRLRSETVAALRDLTPELAAEWRAEILAQRESPARSREEPGLDWLKARIEETRKSYNEVLAKYPNDPALRELRWAIGHAVIASEGVALAVALEDDRG